MGCGCGNMAEGEYTWSGGGLKYAVAMTCEGFDMNTDDWEIIVKRGMKQIVFDPTTAIYDPEGDQWYICVDTALLGPGSLDIIFHALVPDDDFPEGIRHEYVKRKLININSL